MLWASLPDSGASLPTLTFTPHRLAFTAGGRAVLGAVSRPLWTATPQDSGCGCSTARARRDSRAIRLF